MPILSATTAARARSALLPSRKATNDGAFAQADLLFAKFQDDFRQVSKAGRGWRLADPLEGIKRHFRKAEPKEEIDKFGIGEKEMQAIMSLLHKRATSQAGNTFAVHPPRKLRGAGAKDVDAQMVEGCFRELSDILKKWFGAYLKP